MCGWSSFRKMSICARVANRPGERDEPKTARAAKPRIRSGEKHSRAFERPDAGVPNLTSVSNASRFSSSANDLFSTTLAAYSTPSFLCVECCTMENRPLREVGKRAATQCESRATDAVRCGAVRESEVWRPSRRKATEPHQCALRAAASNGNTTPIPARAASRLPRL